MSQLSLYSVHAVLLLDSQGNRIYTKYYNPPHDENNTIFTNDSNLPKTLKKQIEFEKSLVKKTHKQDSEILIFENNLVIYKEYLDLTIYLIGSLDENEIILQQAFAAIRDSLDLILESGIDKKNIQEHYDMVLLIIDETIDNGIILETDSATIASRATKPPANEPQLTLDLDKGLMSAWGFAKNKLQERLQQGL
ncbi:hypothetical protein TBLA_0D02700 [Henningerozyma blattae CBS 6284]|uniref:Coatomer subunit zeta n=1 Tax=Henningerozyma blattae (strain ATCC 34711 / CBS 6284 / DSM 70876 / NBRC 10599 / NRRL Y-10934 / UCD 77-7) TaxID=1071380 RepID=I2H321_HENB6|nr:hypothetical protein TBLA_0D02700 [Tetrapisispora blattae CBS 6284]CCH60773.1 hypothetical protein TBLA_0D02700 [Tetrapisispora blattae CBS 6284]